MESTLRKLFNLYPGEARRASLFLVLGFLWSLGAFGCLTLSEGLFLEHIGAHALPLSYLLTASSMCLLATLLLYALARLSISHLFFCVSLGVILCNLSFALLLSLPQLADTNTLWYLFKITGWISPIAIYICFWAFIDQYYDLQDAKRLFCLFNSLLYLGDACGGALISFGLDSIGVQGLLLLFTFSILSSLPIIYLIVKRRKTAPEESVDGNRPQERVVLKPILKTILSSPFTIALMLFYFLMQLIAISTEYTYMDAFEKAFAASSKTHTLTEFLGKLAMWVSLGNMLFGLFFYSRTVTRVGVNNIVLIAPLFFLSIFVAWSWQETLLLALFALIAREGMTYTFDDNNLLLLISGVPTKIKNQVRIAIESFFEPIGMLVGAALLLFFQSQSKILGFVLASTALIVVFILRSHYARAIFANLVSHSIQFEKKAASWLLGFSKREQKRVETDLFKGLKKNDEEIQLLSYEYLLKMDNPALLPRLLNQAGRFSIRGKLRVIDMLFESSFSHETIVLERLEQWQKMLPHPHCRGAIHFYFAKAKLSKADFMLHHIDSDNLYMKAAAILTLKTFPEKIAHSLLALEKLKMLLHSNDEQQICLGIKILGAEKRPDNLKELLPFLKSDRLQVLRAAGGAIASCTDPSCGHFADALLSSLSQITDAITRKGILSALENIRDLSLVKKLILSSVHFRPLERKQIERMATPFGKEIIPTLETMLCDQKIATSSRMMAGKILGKLSSQLLGSHVRTVVLAEIERAHFYEAQREVVGPLDHDERAILENALSASYRATVDFIIQLLGASCGLEECEVLSNAIWSKNRKIRAHAIETLDKSTDPTLFVLLKPFFDERQIRFKKEQKRLNLEELLDFMEQTPSLANQLVARTLKTSLQEATV